MKATVLALALALAVHPAAGQEKKKAPAKQQQMPVAKGHSKPTPEQIRKFNELQKKQAK